MSNEKFARLHIQFNHENKPKCTNPFEMANIKEITEESQEKKKRFLYLFLLGGTRDNSDRTMNT